MDHCFYMKRLFLTGIFFMVVSVLCTQSNAQKRNKKYDRELVTFMNYVRDSVLKTDTWATRPYFKQIEASASFGSPDYAFMWKSVANDLFSDKEINYISRQIRDTTAFILTEEMIRMAYAKPEALSYDFYQLSVAKFYIEYYSSNKILVNENHIEKIDIDSAKYGRFDDPEYKGDTKVVTTNTALYNQCISNIKSYISRLTLAYTYHFAKPIFVKNYKYCILIYSQGNDAFNGSGKIQIFKRKKKEWILYRTIVKRFSTGHDVY